MVGGREGTGRRERSTSTSLRPLACSLEALGVIASNWEFVFAYLGAAESSKDLRAGSWSSSSRLEASESGELGGSFRSLLLSSPQRSRPVQPPYAFSMPTPFASPSAPPTVPVLPPFRESESSSEDEEEDGEEEEEEEALRGKTASELKQLELEQRERVKGLGLKLLSAILEVKNDW